LTHLPVKQAQARLSMLIPELDDTEPAVRKSVWHEIEASADGLTAVATELTPNEGVLLEDLLTAETLQVDALSMDVSLEYAGLRGAYQAVFSFYPAKYVAFLDAKIERLTEEIEGEGEQPVTVSRALAMAWSRDWLENRDGVSFSPLSAAVDTDVIEELVLRLFESGWVVDDDGRYQPRKLIEWQDVGEETDNATEMEAVRLTWNLRSPVADARRWEGDWAFGEFWSGLDAGMRDTLFSRVPAMQPLDAVPIHITNTIPLDAHEVRKVAVKLHLFGLSQSWEDHEVVFDANSPVTKTQWAVVPRQAPFNYYYAPEIFFGMPENGGWPPPPVRLEFNSRTDPYLPISPATFGFDYLRFEAQPDALETVGFVEIQLSPDDPNAEVGNETSLSEVKSVKLTPGKPIRAVISSSQNGAPYRCYRVLAHPETGSEVEPVVTQDWTAITQERLLITAFHTHVLNPEIINCQLKPGPDFQAVRILLRLRPETSDPGDEGQLLLLDLAEPEASWTYWRESLFELRAYQWRAEIYFDESTGLDSQTLPWRSASTDVLLFDSQEGIA
jgi:hypothetical protein